ncbi:MAG: hypothetical protein IJ506_05600 [Clostridia bacterium]|nr:hypothetical protein [Clostridia bacterium]
MAKQRKGIFILSVVAAFCATIGVAWLSPKPVKAEDTATLGADITISDDWRLGGAMSTFSICEYDNVTKDTTTTGNATYALVPAKTWGGSPAIAPGYVTYKLSADDGYDMASLNAAFLVSYGHCSSGAQCYGNADFQILVSYDNVVFTKVYSLYNDDSIIPEGQTSTKGELTGSDNKITQTDHKYNVSVDLSTYAKGQSEIYVKAYMKVAEATEPLGEIPVRLYTTDLTATQAEESNADIVISNDFLASGKTMSSYSDIYEYSGVTRNSDNTTYGVVPASSWGGTVLPDDGYVTYKIEARNEKALSDMNLNFTAGFGHNGGVYWYQPKETNVLGANARVEISYDNATWQEVYNAHTAQAPITKAAESPDNVYTPSIDLTEYAEGQDVIYVKICLDHFTVEECVANYNAAGTLGWSSVSLGNLGVLLFGVDIQANETDVAAGEYVYSIDYEQTTAKDSVYIASSNAISDPTGNGHYTNGLIPAAQWGDPVTAVAEASTTYKLPLNGNGVYTNFSDLAMNVRYYLNTSLCSEAALSVAYNYDNGDAWTNVDTAFTSGTKKQTTAVDLTAAATAEAALNAEYLYVKITMKHTAGSCNLNKLGVHLHGVEFKGSQNLVMETGASIRLDGNNGIRFTTLVNKELVTKLENAGYTLTYGTFIAPKDYVDTNALTKANLFGDNAIYCWGEAVDGKTQILHREALLVEDYADGYHAFKYSIVDINEANLTRQFVGLGYIKATKDGADTYYMAEYAGGNVENTARSVVYVAQAEVATSTNEEDIQDCKDLYLSNLTASNTATYTVRHIYYSTYYNRSTATTTATAAIGSIVVATPNEKYSSTPSDSDWAYNEESGLWERTVKYYAMQEVMVLDTHVLKSETVGTVLADGKLTLEIYYYQSTKVETSETDPTATVEE